MKKLEQYYWFCPEPFTGVTTATNGQFRPCCVISEELRNLPEEQKYYSNKNSFSDFYNGEFMVKLRECLKTGSDKEFLNKYCSKCISEETAGNRSSRQWYLSKFTNGKFSHMKTELERITEQDTYPTFFHTIQLNNLSGNYCNLTCNMCSEHFSSSIFNEKIKLLEPITVKINSINGRISPLIKETNCDKFNQELSFILNSCLEIKFAGGEPLLSKENYEILRMCDNEDVNIKIITNGTVTPDKFITICKKFKNVQIDISIEGLGKVNEYIRYPSKWVEIINNYKKYISAGFNVTFVTTINAINIGSLKDILNVVDESKVSFASLVNNNFYSLESIPPDLKEMFLKDLKQFKDFSQKQRLINYLTCSEYKEQNMIKMIQHIKRRDKLRGTNLLDVFPEWKEYYENIS